MIREAIQKVVDGQSLTEAEMTDAMNEIMSGDATDAQIASLITRAADERRNVGGDYRRDSRHAVKGDSGQDQAHSGR